MAASLVADGSDGPRMSLTTVTLEADPQVPSCWREQRLDQRTNHGVNQLPAIRYPKHGAAFG